LCKTLDSEKLVWKRHTEQIIKAGKFYSEKEACMSQNKEDCKRQEATELELEQLQENDQKLSEVREEEKVDINIRPKRKIKQVEKLNL